MTNNKLTDETLSAWKAEAQIQLGETAKDMPEYSHHAAIFELTTELQERRAADKNYFMFGIATPEGNAYLEEFCVSSDRGLMEDEVATLNDTHDTDGYRVVALYTAIPFVDSERAELQERRKADSAVPVAWSARDVRNNELSLYSLIDDVNAALSENQYLEVTPLYAAPQPAPVVNDELYKLANHVASSKNGLPEEWQDWAEELESEIRRAAMLRTEPVSEPHKLPKEITGGEPATSSKQ